MKNQNQFNQQMEDTQIRNYFKDKKVLSAKQVSKKFNIKKRAVIKYLSTNVNFKKAEYWDTGYGGKYHLTFKFVGE